MKFNFSTEQEEFRSNLRRLLVERSPSKEVRRLMEIEAGWERDGWRKLNSELGLTALRIPEAYDGQGFGFGELGIVLEEMGRALVCAPYFSTSVLATGAILNAGKEADKQALLPGIAAGFNQVLVCFLQLVFVQFQLRLRQVQLVLDFVLLIRFRLRKCGGEVIHTLLIGGEQRL